MATNIFGTAINCIDGRAQRPVTEWMRMNCHVDYVDMATIPGADQVLAEGTSERIARVRADVDISVQAHESKVIAIAGHHGCAAFPVSREEHIQAIQAAARAVRAWGLPVRVVGLWVSDWWMAEPVYDSQRDPD